MLLRALLLLAGCSTVASVHAQSGCTLEYRVVEAVSNKPLLTWADGINTSNPRAVQLQIAKGSYTAASIVVRKQGVGTCSQISAEISDLLGTGDHPASITAENIKVNYVKVWYQAGTAWTDIRPEGERKLVPELLLNDPELVKVDTVKKRNLLKLIRNGNAEYVDVSVPACLRSGSQIPSNADFYVRDAVSLQPFVPKAAPQQFWVSVNVPPSTPAGNYSGVISFGSGSNKIARIPVTVTVLPFSLPEPSIEYSIFYRGQLGDAAGTVSSEYKNERQYRAELRDLKLHGISNPTVYQDFANRGRLDRALSIRREEGFNSRKIYFLGRSASTAVDDVSKQRLADDVVKLKNILDVHGYEDPYLFAIDEAVGEAQRRQLESWNVVHNAGAKIFATGKAGSYANVGSALDMLVMAFEPDKQEVKRFHAAKRRIMTYAFPQTGPEDPEIFRRNYGLRMWMAGVDGAMPYAYIASAGYSWNDFDHHESRDHQLVYPTVDGVIGTIAWEGFHEGVEDVRYLTALQAAVKTMSEKGRCLTSNCTQALALASEYLSALRNSNGSADLYLMRQKLIEYLVALQPYPLPPRIMRVN